MPERHLLDVLCHTQHYCDWAGAYGPITGVEPKMGQVIERYILTNFAYGTRLGPTQAAKHVKGDITAHTLSLINRRHITAKTLDHARKRLANCYKRFELIKAWGDGSSCAADGTLHALQDENLFTEPHFRYKQKGGIAYHHVADNYILLFSTFIPCGVWEAVEIIEGLLRNDSDIQPDIIHADTQGQSTVVFAIAYLLGFQLMPRIRQWKDLTLFRPDEHTTYQYIDSLFGDPIKWDLISTHWQDMMQVVLSIKAGKASSSVLLRKLGNYSRKNRLYLAFQELGRVIRTEFLLSYIADVSLRESITAATNKAEAYNALSDWVSFGAPKLVASNDDKEMEKAIKYNGILTNAVILQNTVDMSNAINELSAEGMTVRKSDLAYLSPYPVRHLKRFGDFVVDLQNAPGPIDRSQRLNLQ
ncbi:MAG: transposase [Gammaproteobacteria bacterium]|nr:transposase [Gammaproteobacteria bacterium]